MEALQGRRHWDCEKDGEGSGRWGGGGEAGRTGLAGSFGCPATPLGSPGRRASPLSATPCSLLVALSANPGRDSGVFIIPSLSCAARSPAVALQLCAFIVPSKHLQVRQHRESLPPFRRSDENAPASQRLQSVF